MKRLVVFALCVVLGALCTAIVANLFSPGAGSTFLHAIIPSKWLVPKAGDVKYGHTETPFVEELKLIYGNFDIADSCSIPYVTPYPFDDDGKLVICESAKVDFFVKIDTSLLQINNSSRTFLIDTAGIKLLYSLSNSKIITKRYGDMSKISDAEINMQISDCTERFNKSIINSGQLLKAKKALDKLISTQYIYLIQSGYKNLQESKY